MGSLTDAFVAEVRSMLKCWAHSTFALLRFVAILVSLLFRSAYVLVEMLIIRDICVFSVHAILCRFVASKWLSVLCDQAFLFIETIIRTRALAEVLGAFLSGSNGNETAVLATIGGRVFFVAEDGDIPLLVDVAIVHIGFESSRESENGHQSKSLFHF